MGHFTVGKLALAVGAQEHQIRRLADRGKIPCVRAGRYRVFNAVDLPAIRRAVAEAGYPQNPAAEAPAHA